MGVLRKNMIKLVIIKVFYHYLQDYEIVAQYTTPGILEHNGVTKRRNPILNYVL